MKIAVLADRVCGYLQVQQRISLGFDLWPIYGLSVDYHDRGTDYQDETQLQFWDRSPRDGGIFMLDANSTNGDF
jgi:hypothetical protein